MISVLEGRDTLVVMPAGSGKSATYRVPALMLPGPTIVVSPRGVTPKTAPDTAIDDLPFVFLNVAQLDGDTINRVRSARPSLFVVDEAQRIISGTENFLPAYLALGSVITAVGRPLVVALTAEPSPLVQTEIIALLGMRNTAIIVRGFDRPSVFVRAG